MDRFIFKFFQLLGSLIFKFIIFLVNIFSQNVQLYNNENLNNLSVIFLQWNNRFSFIFFIKISFLVFLNKPNIEGIFLMFMFFIFLYFCIFVFFHIYVVNLRRVFYWNILTGFFYWIFFLFLLNIDLQYLANNENIKFINEVFYLGCDSNCKIFINNSLEFESAFLLYSFAGVDCLIPKFNDLFVWRYNLIVVLSFCWIIFKVINFFMILKIKSMVYYTDVIKIKYLIRMDDLKNIFYWTLLIIFIIILNIFHIFCLVIIMHPLYFLTFIYLIFLIFLWNIFIKIINIIINKLNKIFWDYLNKLFE